MFVPGPKALLMQQCPRSTMNEEGAGRAFCRIPDSARPCTTTRCTKGRPSLRDTSTTSAQSEPKLSTKAMPRARPSGNAVPQPAARAAVSITFSARASWASSSRRST